MIDALILSFFISLGLVAMALPGHMYFTLRPGTAELPPGTRFACLAGVLAGAVGTFEHIGAPGVDDLLLAIPYTGYGLSFVVPLLFVVDFSGIPALLDEPWSVLSRHGGPEAIVGRSGPRAIARKLMALTPRGASAGYRETVDWASFEERLLRVAGQNLRRYKILLAINSAFALVPLPFLIGAAFQSTNIVSTAQISLLVLSAGAVSLVICHFARLQVTLSAEALPARILAAHRAHPPRG